MGFNNPGAEAVARHLARGPIEPVLGVNIGKSRITPVEDATDDYLRGLDLLLPFARYLVVNVSSPNTPGLRSLQEAEPLGRLLSALVARIRSAGDVPLLVKLAPDLTDAQIDEAVDVALAAGVSGIVATNTTVEREGLRTPPAELERIGSGGLSGAPLRDRAVQVVRRIYRRTGGRLPVIGVGGVFDGDDAWRLIESGASLVQVYTGFIYRGPSLPREINESLARRVRESGFGSISEAVGSAAG